MHFFQFKPKQNFSENIYHISFTIGGYTRTQSIRRAMFSWRDLIAHLTHPIICYYRGQTRLTLYTSGQCIIQELLSAPAKQLGKTVITLHQEPTPEILREFLVFWYDCGSSRGIGSEQRIYNHKSTYIKPTVKG